MNTDGNASYTFGALLGALVPLVIGVLLIVRGSRLRRETAGRRGTPRLVIGIVLVVLFGLSFLGRLFALAG